MRRVEARTGRRIHISCKPLAATDPSGIWVPTDTVDIIILDASCSATRREAALCHELGHIMLGHRPHEMTAASESSVAAALFSDLDPGLVARYMHRCGYDDDMEREAESFATELFMTLHARRRDLSAAQNRHW